MSPNLTGMGERLRAVREEFGFKQSEFAEKLGVTQNALSQYENGNRGLSEEILQKLVDVFEVNINWLLTGKGGRYQGEDEPDTANWDMVYVDLLDAEACAGNGIMNFEPEVVGKIPVSPDFISPYTPERVRAMRVKGDSMEPTLSSGDVVFFVQGLVNDGNGIYILLRRGELFVKRIHFRMAGDVLDIISDNPKYGNEELKSAGDDAPVLIGRVIYQLHRLN